MLTAGFGSIPFIDCSTPAKPATRLKAKGRQKKTENKSMRRRISLFYVAWGRFWPTAIPLGDGGAHPKFYRAPSGPVLPVGSDRMVAEAATPCRLALVASAAVRFPLGPGPWIGRDTCKAQFNAATGRTAPNGARTKKKWRHRLCLGKKLPRLCQSLR